MPEPIGLRISDAAHHHIWHILRAVTTPDLYQAVAIRTDNSVWAAIYDWAPGSVNAIILNRVRNTEDSLKRWAS